MYNLFSLRRLRLLAALLVIVSLVSCGGSRKAQKDLLYLQGNLDTLPNSLVAVKEATIQKGDLLNIIVYSDNLEATAIFNQRSSTTTASITGSSANMGGYLVDQKGFIYFHSLGSVKVEGLTKSALMELLTDKLKGYLLNPYVAISFLNNKFTVIGEVNKPGSYTIPNEKVSVLEMLGLAGDLTVYGRRDNILVIREREGKREFGRIDLRKADIFQSPYFYLQQNDIVLVEANPKKSTVNDQVISRRLTIASGIAALASTFAIIYNILK